MAQIKWIKLSTDIFENRKIRRLRSQRNGDKMTLLYIMLLTMAGRCNDGGQVFYTEDIPYTEKTLGAELGFSEQQMKVWLKTLSDLALIEVDEEGFVFISGWKSHQNVEKLDLIREQNKQRKRKQREREKAESGEKFHAVTRDSHVTVTPGHATEEDIDIEKERDIEIEEKEIEKKSKKEKGANAPGADALTTLSSLFSQYSFSTG